MTEKQWKVYGVVPPVLTMLAERDGEYFFDPSNQARLLDCLSPYSHGLFPAGTTGGGPSLTHKIWRELIGFTVQYVRESEEHKEKPVFAGVIRPGTLEAIELVKEAKDLGVNGVVATPPFYLSTKRQSEILRHYEMIRKAAGDLVVIAYIIPSKTGCEIDMDTYKALVRSGLIDAVKDSSADDLFIKEMIPSLLDNNVAPMQGAEFKVYPALRAGAVGCVQGLANVAPEICREIYDAVQARGYKRGQEAQERFDRLRPMFDIPQSDQGWLKAIHQAAIIRGIVDENARLVPPFDQPCTPEEREGIEGILKDVGLGKILVT